MEPAAKRFPSCYLISGDGELGMSGLQSRDVAFNEVVSNTSSHLSKSDIYCSRDHVRIVGVVQRSQVVQATGSPSLPIRALVRHVANLGLSDGFDSGGYLGSHGVSCGWSVMSTVGVRARRAASLLWVALRPGMGLVVYASVGAYLDEVPGLPEGRSAKHRVRNAVASATALNGLGL